MKTTFAQHERLISQSFLQFSKLTRVFLASVTLHTHGSRLARFRLDFSGFDLVFQRSTVDQSFAQPAMDGGIRERRSPQPLLLHKGVLTVPAWRFLVACLMCWRRPGGETRHFPHGAGLL